MKPAVGHEANQGKEAMYVRRRISILTDESPANDCQSLLLKLPQEIKDKIYELVCGGELLHFHSALRLEAHSQDKLCHYECVSRTTEEAFQASFNIFKLRWLRTSMVKSPQTLQTSSQ